MEFNINKFDVVTDQKILKTDIVSLKDEVDNAIKLREEAFIWLKNLAENDLPFKSNAYLLEELKQEQEMHSLTRYQLEEKLCMANAEIENLKHQLRLQKNLNNELASLTNNKLASRNVKRENPGLMEAFEKLKQEIERQDDGNDLADLSNLIKVQRNKINTLVHDSIFDSKLIQENLIEPTMFNNTDGEFSEDVVSIASYFNDYPELRQILEKNKDLISKYKPKNSNKNQDTSTNNFTKSNIKDIVDSDFTDYKLNDSKIFEKSAPINTSNNAIVKKPIGPSLNKPLNHTINSSLKKSITSGYPQIKCSPNGTKKTNMPSIIPLDVSKLIGLARSVEKYKAPKFCAKNVDKISALPKTVKCNNSDKNLTDLDIDSLSLNIPSP